MVNVVVAYVLWVFGGWFGLHQFYLGRDRHAFALWSTFGGCFGFGWLRDLWHLPEYVAESSRDPRYENLMNERMRRNPTPSPSTARFSGQILLGCLFGYLTRFSIPEEIIGKQEDVHLIDLLLPAVTAIGVHLVGNIGRETCTMKMAMIGAYLPAPLLYFSVNNILYSSLASAALITYKGTHWRTQRRKRRHLCKRIIILSACCFLYLSLISSSIYFNAYITTKDGDEVRLRDAVHNFFKSTAWTDTKEGFTRIYNYYRAHGFKRFWEQVVEVFDPQGEANAYKVLGLNDTATQKEITTRYKTLAKQYHPDKVRDPEKKKDAQDKFIEIQQSYEILSTIKENRARKNKEKRDNPEHSHQDL